MTPSDHFVGHDLGVAATRFHRAMKQSVATALEPFGLTGAAYGALHFIDGHDEPSNTELARYLIITPQALGRLTAQLEGEELVVRRRAGESLRYSLALTVEGARRMSAAQPAVEAAQQTLLAPLTAAERKQLADALTACSDHHENTTKGSA